ncbi:hypothetical protein F5Y16DRAFT_391397 [Xylariaceae sp. FL0255]|nr:hypothetical protein F5Y16DRAFT_391397 [Xylariaceae sp. FL0255]
MFFDHFATWENEQLACIHDFLLLLVAEPFNFLVEHDVTWGYLCVPYIDRYDDGQGQAILAEGLQRIYQISQASDYEELHQLLSRGEDRNDEPLSAAFFLCEGIERGANPLITPFIAISEMNEEDLDIVIAKPFYDDPDSGPASMWRWINRDWEPTELVAMPWMRIHRQWAFPFWDLSRLEAVGLLQDKCLPGPVRSDPNVSMHPVLDKYADLERLEYLAKLRTERCRIWRQGGVGFYSYQEASTYIKWLFDHGRRVQVEQPRSLDEAKQFLKTFAAQGWQSAVLGQGSNVSLTKAC